MELVPVKCLSALPFTAEPIAAWTTNSDIAAFLQSLFADVPSYGQDLYKQGRSEFLKTAREFAVRARETKPTPAAQRKAETPPDLRNDNCFGSMAKHFIGWDGLMSQVLSESGFFSLAHILECTSDLECSILLASHLYYKQALQALRNFLENTVVDLYFFGNQEAFDRWKANQFRMPRFRGRGGMIENLVLRDLIPKKLGQRAELLYEELNGSIHGAERRLVHRGLFSGDYHGLLFNYSRFREWCDTFCSCVDVGIRVLSVTVAAWQESSAGQVVCDVCHENRDFDVSTDLDSLGKSFTRLRCRRCDHEKLLDSRYAASKGFV